MELPSPADPEHGLSMSPHAGNSGGTAARTSSVRTDARKKKWGKPSMLELNPGDEQCMDKKANKKWGKPSMLEVNAGDEQRMDKKANKNWGKPSMLELNRPTEVNEESVDEKAKKKKWGKLSMPVVDEMKADHADGESFTATVDSVTFADGLKITNEGMMASRLGLASSKARHRNAFLCEGAVADRCPFGCDITSHHLYSHDQLEESEELIARGACGQVSKRVCKRTGNPVAVKVICLAVRTNVLQAKAEIDAMEHLSGNPHVVRLLGAYVHDGRLHIVSEFAELGSPKPLTLSPQQLRVAAKDILSALHHTHRKGYVHRDVKPANTVLFANGHAKLTDFGLAVHVSNNKKTKNRVGTRAYTEPHLFGTDLPHDQLSDVYSYGLTLKDLAMGPDEKRKDKWVVWGQQNTSEQEQKQEEKQKHDEEEQEQEQQKDCFNAQLDVVLKHCLQAKREQRWTAQELLELPFFDTANDTMCVAQRHTFQAEVRDATQRSLWRQFPCLAEVTFAELFRKDRDVCARILHCTTPKETQGLSASAARVQNQAVQQWKARALGSAKGVISIRVGA